MNVGISRARFHVLREVRQSSVGFNSVIFIQMILYTRINKQNTFIYIENQTKYSLIKIYKI